MEMNWISVLAMSLLAILVIALILVLAMVFWPRAHPFRGKGHGIEAHRTIETANGVIFDQVYPFQPVCFDIDDGGRIAARIFGSDEAQDIIVLVHGIGAAGARWNHPAGLLAETAGAQVVVVELRGHNESSGRRYDLERIGQYEEDLAQVIASIQSDRPEARIWLAGHSMGGGIALRFTLKIDRSYVAGYLLFAPAFGPGPTAPATAPANAVLRIDRIRITGLILLKLIGIRAFNHRLVAYLNMPPDFPAYSFTAMASILLPLPPNTVDDGLKAMEGPFLIIAGAEDQSVRVDGYREVAAAHSKGCVEIRPGHGHDSVLNDQETCGTVARWLRQQGGLA